MNSFGSILRGSIFGESHGRCVGITLSGVPPGVALSAEDFTEDIKRRQPRGLAGTPRREKDTPLLFSGAFRGKTTGAPLTVLFENQDVRPQDYEAFHHVPRPGHADFVAIRKYKGYADPRGGGHFSGRLTLPLVAVGVLAKKIIAPAEVKARVVEVGGERVIEKGLEKAMQAKDSVGGIVRCEAHGVPVGCGEPFFHSVESLISHLVFSIPAVKGISFGSGFEAARMFGSEHNDAIVYEDGTARTNHSGGVSGGISNGNPLVFEVCVKPTSSTPKTQSAMNLSTRKMEALSVRGRHDLCIALRVPVVVEAVTAWVLADMLLMGGLCKKEMTQTSLKKDYADPSR